MSTAPDLTLAALKMVISLGLVLVIIWWLYRVARKRLPMPNSGGSGKMMHVLESQYLGVKKTITMVQVPGSVLVLGIGPDRVNLLTRIDDPAILKGISSNTDGRDAVVGFREQFLRLTRPKKSGTANNAKPSAVEQP